VPGLPGDSRVRIVFGHQFFVIARLAAYAQTAGRRIGGALMNHNESPGSGVYRQATRPSFLANGSLAVAWRAAFLLLIATIPAPASAPVGIPRELARERAARISNVSYHLTFTLIPHADSVVGSEEPRFTLRDSQPVLLDFRDGTIASLRLMAP
jgi:hypothetical protein